MYEQNDEGVWTPPGNDYRALDLSELQTIEDCDEASSWLCERAIALHDQITMVVNDDDVHILKSHLARLHNLRNEVRILKSEYWREDVEASRAEHLESLTRKHRALEKLAEDPAAREVIEAKKQAQLEIHQEYLDSLDRLQDKKHRLKLARIERSNQEREPFLRAFLNVVRDELGREEQLRLCALARDAVEATRTADDAGEA